MSASGPVGRGWVKLGWRSASSARAKACAALEEVFDASSDRFHPLPERPPRHGAVSHAMPVVKDDLGGPLQFASDLRAGTPALYEARKLAKQVRLIQRAG